MGKNAFLGGPKDIANKMKAKGLQKLRFYCQMCNKQCRDENGFKCHLTSESHKRQMDVFGQAPQRVIQGFSEEFETTFMEHLRRCHPFSRVSANVVYNEFIQDRQHVHMNSTKWLTLTEFVKYLGREGKCKVDDTPKGWYITLIQKDPFEELGEKKRAKRERAEREEDERRAKALAEQIERAQKAAEGRGGGGEAEEDAAGHDFRPEAMQGPLGFSLAGAARARDAEAAAAAARAVSGPGMAFEDGDEPGGAAAAGLPPPAKKSKLEQLMERDLAAKKHQTPGPSSGREHEAGGKESAAWLAEGIVVKVVSAALREHGYYKKKGVVVRVIDQYIGEIEMAGSGDVVRVDQAELETVVPAPGGQVLVVAGPLRGSTGTLEAIDEAAFAAEVRVKDRRSGERRTVKFEYEDFSKLA